MVIIPTITFLIIAVRTNPCPNLALRKPVKVTDNKTEMMVAGHCQAVEKRLMAISGKAPPSEAAISDEKAAFQGFI